MVKNHSTHSWLGGFTERLVQLRPTLNVATAVQYAVMSIHYAAELDPRRAAEIVLSNPASEAVKKRRAARARESQATRYQTLFGSHFGLSASRSGRGEPRSAAQAR